MTYPNTGSTLDAGGGVNKTSTAISTNILIVVGPTPVGAVQSLQITENREIRMIDEVGTDGHIDSVPVRSTNVTGTCTRIRFDRLRIAEAFGRSYLHVKSQRFPFDIVIIDNWNGNPLNAADNSAAIITTIKNVWIGEIGYSYQANDWIITDTMQWQAETISSTLGQGATPAAQGGERNIPIALASPTSDIEQAADTGARRGALDSPGILKAFLPF
jgi:hypothetical protein